MYAQARLKSGTGVRLRLGRSPHSEDRRLSPDAPDAARDYVCVWGVPHTQKTGVSLQTPHTARSASHISPIVTNALEASTIGGIRLRSSWDASSFRRASAVSTEPESRRA